MEGQPPAPRGARGALLLLLAVLWLLFQVWIVRNPLPPLVERPIHLSLALAVLFLAERKPPAAGPARLRIAARTLESVILLGVGAVAAYFLVNAERMGSRMEDIDPVFQSDVLFGSVLILLLLEGVRRTAGWSLLGVILTFLGYAALGPWLPGAWGFSGFRVDQITDLLALSGNGIWGITTETSVQFVYYFVAFGAFYAATGGGQLLIDAGLRLSARQPGAAAKAAVISSSLMGSISGSAVANVVATGVFTVPLMRQGGYSRDRAAAVEAIASTGGQLMPPVMGVAAFLMAELLQREYWEIAVAGLIPAAVYYASVFFLVDLEARRERNIAAVEPGDAVQPLLPRAHLLLPPLALVAALATGASATLAALYGIAACVAASLIRKQSRKPLRLWLETVEETARMAAQVAVPIAAIGIIVAVAIQSNVALKFSSVLIDTQAAALPGLAGTIATIRGMAVVMAGCLIMGMGLPTVAAYVIGAILFVPALQPLGLTGLTAHFFVMYFCVLSMVTPPVALASYAAAGLCGGSPLRTSIEAFRLSLVCFLIPFAFAFDPHLLGQDAGWWTVAAIASLLLAGGLWAAALAGYLRAPMRSWQRILAAATAILLILCPTGSAPWLFAVAAGGALLAVLWFAPAPRKAGLTV